MTILNLHDRRAIEAIVERMPTDAIARCLDEGALSAFAREVVAEELARRVLADDVIGRRRALPALDHAADVVVLLVYLASLAASLGLFK